jgi:hypothetical protein
MSYQADERYDVYHEVRVFARKEHECDSVLCSEPIRKGDSYWRISVVFDGRARTIKRCLRCQHIHVHLRELCSDAGDAFTDMWPDERLACGLDYAEEWGPIPQEIAALAFWKPGEPLPCDTGCYPTGRWGENTTTCCYLYYRGDQLLTARCQRGDLRWEHWPARTPNPCTEAPC